MTQREARHARLRQATTRRRSVEVTRRASRGSRPHRTGRAARSATRRRCAQARGVSQHPARAKALRRARRAARVGPWRWCAQARGASQGARGPSRAKAMNGARRSARSPTSGTSPRLRHQSPMNLARRRPTASWPRTRQCAEVTRGARAREATLAAPKPRARVCRCEATRCLRATLHPQWQLTCAAATHVAARGAGRHRLRTARAAETRAPRQRAGAETRVAGAEVLRPRPPAA